MPVTKEEILNDYPFYSDNSIRLWEEVEILAAMDEWAAIQTAERDARIKELEKYVVYAERVGYETSVKNADMIAEINRLKELIKKAWSLDATQMTWEQFCEMSKL